MISQCVAAGACAVLAIDQFMQAIEILATGEGTQAKLFARTIAGIALFVFAADIVTSAVV